jgi:hypothetical protein
MNVLSPSQVLAEARRLLEKGGYSFAHDPEGLLGLPAETALLAEDKYSVVAVVVFETWTELDASWAEAESSLIGAISERLSRAQPKTWDAYLILLTPGPTDQESDERALQISYDTSRTRKLVATGRTLLGPSDIESVLLPVLPLMVDDSTETASTLLDELPQYLLDHGVRPEVANRVVGAFRERRPLVGAIAEGLES